MPDLSVKRTPSAIVLLCLAFAACSTANKNPAKQTPVQPREIPAAGDFQKALDGFKEARKSNPDGKKLTSDYIRIVEEIKGAADRASGQRDYARARGLYRLLLKNHSDFEPFAPKLTFHKGDLETALKKCRVALVDAPARQALKGGNFARALGIFRAARKDDPEDADLTAGYLGMVADIKAAGDKALSEQDFVPAGRANVCLLKNYASFASLRPDVAFSREALTDAVAACRESLTKSGLAEYRKGNPVKAIAVWENLLSFDPDNAEIKKAVGTDRTQLNEIQKKK
jgi:tetratricopeptide (TPR) repeat protein